MIDIIIVNWNSGNYLYKCIESLSKISNSPSHFPVNKVIIIDNYSSDDSFERINTFKDKVPLILVRNVSNIGFSAACNQGATHADSEFLLFLNPDTEIFQDTLELTLTFMKSNFCENSNIGICGIQLVDSDLRVTPSCSRFPNPLRIIYTSFGLNRIFPTLFKRELMTDFNHLDTTIVDQVKGAYFLTKKSLFDSLGGFDERFFVYYEEVDFSLRAKQKGFASCFFSGAQVYHKGCGTTESVSGLALFYFLRSRTQYLLKHHTLAITLLIVLLSLTIEPIARLIYSIFKISCKDFISNITAYTYFFKWLIFDFIVSEKVLKHDKL